MPEPQRAVDAALQATGALRQHHRRGIRAWLARWRHPGMMQDAGEPEVILDATAPAWDSAAPALSPVMAAPRSIPVGLTAIVVGLIAVVAVTYLAGVPSVGPLSPGADVRRGVMTLPGPAEDGRDIIVAADGTGHFWTLADAVSEAVDGDRILVKPGEYRESIKISGKDVSITGEGGPEAVVVRPSAVGPMVRPEGYTSPSDFDESDTFDVSTWEVPPEWRYIFFLQDSDASVSGMSLIGSRVGSAVIIDGGAPVLDDLVIDPEGDQGDGDPAEPHEALYVYGGSDATLRDSEIYALVSIRDASSPTLREDRIEDTCVLITGPGTKPTLMGNTIRASSESAHCPGFSVAINGGSAPLIEANTIENDRRIDGLIILGPDTAPTVQGNNITGADVGIWIGRDGRGLISRNNVVDANAGYQVVGSSPQLNANQAFHNDIGVSIDGGSMPGFLDNEVCDNGTNVELLDGARIPMELNVDVCSDTDMGDPTSG